MAKFLFNDTIKEIAINVGPTLNEPKHIGGGAWDRSGKTTLNFFRLLRDFGEGKIDSDKLMTILKCKDLKELAERSLEYTTTK